MVELLQQYGKNYTIVPFDLKEYSKLKLSFDRFEPDGRADYVHHKDYFKGTKKTLLFKQAVELDKNLYVCNVNGVWNMMIEIGRSMGATWILPWDGNCFVTDDAFEVLYSSFMNEKGKYILTPTHRVTGENDQILDPDYQREPSEEPMVSFRFDAIGRFHPMLWYGRRDKIELLRRLKAPGPWYTLNFEGWENRTFIPPLLSPIKDVGDQGLPHIGWTFRLSSGNPLLEKGGISSSRSVARIESVVLLTSNLVALVAKEIYGFSATKLLFYNSTALRRDRQLFDTKDPTIVPLVTQLLALANKSLSACPWSVMDKPNSSCAPSKDCHDYYSPHPHFWPKISKNANQNAKVEFSLRDEKIPDAEIFGNSSHRFDSTRFTLMQHNTATLALAYYMTDEMAYALHAADLVRTWFVSKKTRMNPHMEYASAQPEPRKGNERTLGIIEMKDVYYMLDTIRILQDSRALSISDHVALTKWFTLYLEWLETSHQGNDTYMKRNHSGVYYDLQIVSVAAFVNDTQKMLWYLDRSISRLKDQVSSNGTMLHEIIRRECEHYQLFTLQGWLNLARLGRSVGRNLWEAYPFELDGMELSALCRAFYALILSLQKRGSCPTSNQKVNQKRWWPLWYEAHYNFPGLIAVGTLVTESMLTRQELQDVSEIGLPESQYNVPSMFHPYDGIAPFWNLGLPGA